MFRFLGILVVLFVTALLSKDTKNKKDTFSYMWVILNSTLSLDERKDLLKRHLNILTSKWVKYFEQYKEILEADYKPMKTFQKLAKLTVKIIKGEISFGEIVYIFVYCIYAILISGNVFHIPTPWDIVINVGFLTFLRYAGSDLKGFTEVLGDFLIAIKPGLTPEEYEENLNELKDKIKDDCYACYFLDEEVILQSSPETPIEA